MRLDFTGFLFALSYALDAAEKEVTGATAEHGKRVAWITWKCASTLGLTDREVIDLTACAILHDCAIAEYIREELEQELEADPEYEARKEQYGTTSIHAQLGEAKVLTLPLRTDMKNVILWHHENPDGSGPFGKTEAETNLYSQIIRLADGFDMTQNLSSMTQEEFEKARNLIRQNTGVLVSSEAARLFLENITYEDVKELQEKGPEQVLREHLPTLEEDYTDEEILRIAYFFAEIVDFKSSFTKDHSIGVARKAKQMAEHYGFDHGKTMRYTFAGAMHDIGKMVVGNDILEKPDKLDASEFRAMKNHAAETYKILSKIQGLDDVTEWAANHHEKLDGTGYSRRLSGEQQTFEDRLMACIDIYQALTEPRPYKDGLSHKRSIGIMEGMAADGKIDGEIVAEMKAVFGADAAEEIEEQGEARLTTKVWKCPVCGYEYEGDTPPATCPICDTDAEQFELQ